MRNRPLKVAIEYFMQKFFFCSFEMWAISESFGTHRTPKVGILCVKIIFQDTTIVKKNSSEIKYEIFGLYVSNLDTAYYISLERSFKKLFKYVHILDLLLKFNQ